MNIAADGKARCAWGLSDPLYLRYHDEEWGVPVCPPGTDAPAQPLFERLVLEGMQAGLSWLTVLRKREAMRQAFHGFDPTALAAAGEADLTRWLADAGVIRNAAKLRALVGNARAFLALDDPAHLLWSFVDGQPLQNRWREAAEVPSETPASKAMSRELKRLGFKFVGPTICYAFMQSVGMVNDHLVSCFRHSEVVGAIWKDGRAG